MKLTTCLRLAAFALLFSTSISAAVEKKILVLSLNFTEGEVLFENADFAYGTPPNALTAGDFYAKVISREGSATYETFFKDPRKSFSETFYENGSIEGFKSFDDNAKFKLVLGVDDDSSVVKIIDVNQTTLLTIYLNELEVAKAFFCQIPNKICDPGFCGETDVDCLQGKQPALTQEKQKGALKESQNNQETAQEEAKQSSSEGQKKIEGDRYYDATNIIYALILLLLAYVVTSVVFKHVKNK